MIVHNHPKLRDTWPPEPGGAFRSSYRLPEGGADVLEQVLYYSPVTNAKANIALRTRFEGHEYTRDILLDDPLFATRLASWLRRHVGSTIQEIGNLEVDF